MLIAQRQAQRCHQRRLLALRTEHKPVVRPHPNQAQPLIGQGGAGTNRQCQAQRLLYRQHKRRVPRIAAQIDNGQVLLAYPQGLRLGVRCKGGKLMSLKHFGAPTGDRKTRSSRSLLAPSCRC